MTTVAKTSHPAKFPNYVLARIRMIVRTESRLLRRPVRVLDPFAGCGRIHDLPGGIASTTGVEIEPEWAACRERTIVGNACNLPTDWTAAFDAVITAPSNGNRLADANESKDNCMACGGTGTEWNPDGCGDAPMFCDRCHRADCVCGGFPATLKAHIRLCPTCNGVRCTACGGAGTSKRYTYRHALGRMPTDGSSVTMPWGAGYRALHEQVWAEAWRVLVPAGLVIVNTKNHVRNGNEQQVVQWHEHALRRLGFDIVGTEHLRSQPPRIDHERLILGRKPAA